MSKRCFYILSLGLLMGGCTMMPKYDRPPVPVSSAWPIVHAKQCDNALQPRLDWRDFFEDPRCRVDQPGVGE